MTENVNYRKMPDASRLPHEPKGEDADYSGMIPCDETYDSPNGGNIWPNRGLGSDREREADTKAGNPWYGYPKDPAPLKMPQWSEAKLREIAEAEDGAFVGVGDTPYNRAVLAIVEAKETEPSVEAHCPKCNINFTNTTAGVRECAYCKGPVVPNFLGQAKEAAPEAAGPREVTVAEVSMHYKTLRFMNDALSATQPSEQSHAYRVAEYSIRQSKPSPATEGEFEEWWAKDPVWTTPKNLAKAAWNAARSR